MGPAFAASLVFVGFGLFIVFLLKFGAAQSRKALESFNRLAARLGLTPEPAKLKLGFWSGGEANGELRGKRARLYSYTTGSGKSRTVWCAVAVQPRQTGGLTFSLTPQGLGSKVAELFGAKEITVGDPAFDKAWFIRTNQPEFFAAALLPELRTRLAAAIEGQPHPWQPSVKLEKGAVIYAEAGAFNHAGRCERLFRMADILCDFADIAEVHAQNTSHDR